MIHSGFCTRLPSSALSAVEPSHSVSTEGPLLGLLIPPQSQLKSCLGANKLWYLKTRSSCFTFLLSPSAKLRANKTNPGVCFHCSVSTNFGETETCVFLLDSFTGLINILTDIIWRFTGDFMAPDLVCRVVRYLQVWKSPPQCDELHWSQRQLWDSLKEITTRPVFTCNPSLPSS